MSSTDPSIRTGSTHHGNRPSATLRRTLGVGTALAVVAVLSACTAAAPSSSTTASGDGTVTIYLTRHGETMLNELERAQGWSDSPLTEAGVQSATDLGVGLAESGVEFESAYSADMVRHFESISAALDAAGSELEPTRLDGLREMAFGKFEGATNEELWGAVAAVKGYPDAGALLADAPELGVLTMFDGVAEANGDSDLTAETSDVVGDRVIAALDQIAEDQLAAGGGDVLVVSSGISIICALSQLTDDLSDAAAGITNSAVSILEYRDGTWTVKSVNDTSYVEAGAAQR